jgi:TonB family protein
MDISQEFIRKVMLGIKYDAKKTLSENKTLILEDSNQCKDKWYWYAEVGEDKRSPGRKCWDGKDPLSCELRTFLGEDINSGIMFCRNADTIIPCSDNLSYSNACVIGKQGDKVLNPYKSFTLDWYRNENYVVDPISPNNSNLQVEVFKERTELISLLDVLLGVKNKKLSGSKGTGQMLSNHFRIGNDAGCYFWSVEGVTDNKIITVLNTLKNQTSISFGDTEEGETNVQKLEGGTGKETQTISAKIINTIDTETGEKYNFKEVQTDFGVKPYNKQEPKDSTTNKENFNDNLKLNKAWELGWRPNNDMEVPENLQTNTYKNNSSSNNTKNSDEPNDVNNNNQNNNADNGNSNVNGDVNNDSEGGKGEGEGNNITTDAIPTTISYLEDVSKPKFNNGELGWSIWFNKNFTYPEKAINKNITGTVTASFDVGVNGLVTNVKIIGSPSKILSDEVLRLIKKMPNWVPAEKNGIKIKTNVILPIIFSL